jgi:DNA-binding response OmpR family regulator
MRVLIVEDEHRIARYLKKGLEQQGHVATVAQDGATALARARAGAFDVILLDWMLPDVDGLSVCQTLRAEGNHTAIIMLTAKDDVTDRVLGLDSGADDYVTKPFALQEVFARIRAVTRRAEAGAAPQLVVADLVLDPTSHVVTRAGAPITLSAKEFTLLEFLMRRAGQVVTRQDILQHVWGYDHDPKTNVVDVYIRYLRRKIDQAYDRPLIHTLINVGYKLEG